MDPKRRNLLLAVGGGLSLAGCLGDDDDDDGTGDDSDTGNDGDDGDMDDTGDDTDGDDNGDDTGTPGGDVTVSVGSHDELGDILVDADGLTLYVFDVDEQGAGASECYEDCAENWPPLTVDEEPTPGDSVDAELTTLERDDGSMQVAANGWPLYYWMGDEAEGDVNGQGVNDVWWVLSPSGEPIMDSGGEDATVAVSSHDDYGDILVDADGLSLYLFDADEQDAGESTCYDDCAENWPPLIVEDDPMASGDVEADLSTFDRDDGSMQVAANGWPLYYWMGDQAEGDVNGQGVNDVWWLVSPAGEPVQEEQGEDDTTGPGY